MIVLAMVMIVSGAVIVNKKVGEHREQAVYDALREDMAAEEETTAAESTEAVTEADNSDTMEMEAEPEAEAYVAPQALLDIMSTYPDCVGYIDIDGTNIHYPIMQNADNEFYLHRDMDGKKSFAGAIYMDANHDIHEKGLHVIYGHNMKNGTMFKDIVKFHDAQYMETHQQISIKTADREIKLKPVYCYASKADGSYRNEIRTHGQVIEFIKDHTDLEIDADDLYVLVTCSYYKSQDERTFLMCVPVGDESAN